MIRSIRARITLWYALWIIISFVALGVVVYANLSSRIYSQLDGELRARAKWVGGYLKDAPRFVDWGELQRELQEHATPLSSRMLIEVRNQGHRTIFRSANLGDRELPPTLSRAAFQAVTFRNAPLRSFAAPVRNIGWRVVVAIPDVSEREALSQLLRSFLLFAPAAVIVASMGGWFLAAKSLRPVDELTRRAREFTADRPTESLYVPSTSDEISRLAQTLNDMMSRLQDSFSRLRQFTADASHELRTPLTAMRGQVEVALQRERSLLEYQQILASNLEEIRRMAKIVEQLLTLSKADRGELELEKEPIELATVVRDVCDRYSVVANEAGVQLAHDTNGVVQINADRLRIEELLINLVDNGLKHTPQGGEVRINLERHDGNVVIKVSDTGIGIAPEHLPHIFERFYRVDKARSREQGGSGLGLSICRWIAEAHGGNITVRSESGVGSEFIVRLPLQH